MAAVAGKFGLWSRSRSTLFGVHSRWSYPYLFWNPKYLPPVPHPMRYLDTHPVVLINATGENHVRSILPLSAGRQSLLPSYRAAHAEPGKRQHHRPQTSIDLVATHTAVLLNKQPSELVTHRDQFVTLFAR